MLLNEFNSQADFDDQLSQNQAFKLRLFVWKWFDKHKEDVILRVTTPIIGITIFTVRVKHAEKLIEWIFGDFVT